MVVSTNFGVVSTTGDVVDCETTGVVKTAVEVVV